MAVIIALDILAGVIVALLLLFVLFAVRRRLVQRRGATFDCSLRRCRTLPGRTGPGESGSSADEGEAGKGWLFGVARYSGDRLEWYRVFSYSPRPREVLMRRDIQILGRRAPAEAEALALLSGAYVLECRHQDRTLELAMSEQALTGFLSWVESAPPGHRVNVA